MKRAKAAIAAATMLFASAVIASACRAPTQIRVLVTAPGDSVCQPRLRTAISVGRADSYEHRAASSTAVGCASHGVGSLVVVPSGGETADVAIRVVASLDGSPCEPPGYGPSCIVARRALHFIPNETLTVIVELQAACENVACTPETTCVGSTCVGATIGDPSQCATSCGSGALGPPADAGAPDASVTTDGGVAGGVGGPVLAVGDQFVCLKRASGVVACWGQNGSGELGFFPSDGGAELLPVDVPALGSPVALSGSGSYGCELLPGGVMKCWGDNGPGVLGLPASDAGALPPRIVASGSAAICAGAYASCTIDVASGAVRCWSGQRATDGYPVNGISGAVQLACGSDVGCARIADGTVRCWGGSSTGDLGVPDAAPSDIAVQPSITGVVDLAMYFHHACAALADGGVKCWGTNSDLESDPSYDAGADASASAPGVDTPTLVAGVSGATQVAVGIYHSCALLGDGGVVCWGDNHGDQVGSNACSNACTPVPVSSLPHAVYIKAAQNETCAVLDDGGVWCWGTNVTGELGRGIASGSELPAPVHL